MACRFGQGARAAVDPQPTADCVAGVALEQAANCKRLRACKARARGPRSAACLLAPMGGMLAVAAQLAPAYSSPLVGADDCDGTESALRDLLSHARGVEALMLTSHPRPLKLAPFVHGRHAGHFAARWWCLI